jgi:hypothetical protein
MIERIPIFCVVLKDGEHWQVEAEWPDGTIEEVHDLDEPEPVDEIADCDALHARAGNDAGAPRGRRRARDHRGAIRYPHD